VHVLNGVYEAVWQGVSDMPVETGVLAPTPCHFAIETLVDHSELRVTTEDVVALSSSGDDKVALLDVLDNWPNTGQKYGRAGHIKGAVSTPYLDVVDAKSGRFMDRPSFVEYISLRVDLDKPCVAYCHGGISATVLLFLLEGAGLGGAKRKLYADSMFVYVATDPELRRPFNDLPPSVVRAPHVGVVA
jgi:3-mercaptopyruvate sulfurtransferase SseA